jgi:SRSO17 transposase
MGLGSELEHANRFAAYVNELTKVRGHADREKPFRDYCAGLLATEGRRSVEPMAVVADPGRANPSPPDHAGGSFFHLAPRNAHPRRS